MSPKPHRDENREVLKREMEDLAKAAKHAREQAEKQAPEHNPDNQQDGQR